MMMCDGVSPSSWMMYSPRSDSSDSMPCSSRKSFKCISSETIDLPFTTRVAPCASRISSTIALASSVVSAQWTRMPLAAQFSSSVLEELRQAAPACGRGSRRRGRADRATRRGRRTGRRAWLISPSMARRKFARSCGSFSAAAAAGPEGGSSALSAHVVRSHRNSATWRARTVSPLAPRAGPPMFRRQPPSPERRIGAPVEDVAGLVLDHGRRDLRAARTAKVPPKPQHSRSRDSGASSTFASCARRLPGLVLDSHLAQRVAGGVPGDTHLLAAVGQLHLQHVARGTASARTTRAAKASRLRRRTGRPRRARDSGASSSRRRSPTGPRSGTARGKSAICARATGPRLLVVAAVERRLPAAGLPARKDDPDSLALEQPYAREPRLRKEEVHEAGAVVVDGSRLFAAACSPMPRPDDRRAVSAVRDRNQSHEAPG